MVGQIQSSQICVSETNRQICAKDSLFKLNEGGKGYGNEFKQNSELQK